VLFDFISSAGNARWTSSYGKPLSFPGKDTNSQGFVLPQENALLEDGSRFTLVLETHPRWVDNGWILGDYEDTARLRLRSVDRLVVTVGFLNGAQAGDVFFRVRYADCHPMDPDCFDRVTVVEIRDRYDGRLVHRVVPLDGLVGQSGWFWLEVHANGSSAQDWAVWAEARIERP